MSFVQIQPQAFVGTWRRFGPAGPVYEIIAVAGHKQNGDRLMRIRVLDSGEEAELRLDHLLDDPAER